MATTALYEWIFWRHAQANNGRVDLARRLSEHGFQQAQRSADWLRSKQVDFPVVSSAAVRTQQTANAFSSDIEIVPAINPGTLPTAVLQTLQSRAQNKMIVVGHQPWIGQVTAQLLSGQFVYYPYETCDLYWLRSEDGMNWTQYAHLPNRTLF